MLLEIIEALKPVSGGKYLDATFGGGGHSRALLEASAPDGRVIGLDRDPAVEKYADELIKVFGVRFEFAAISFTEMRQMMSDLDGIVFDLGLSSDQLEASGRGFSFQKGYEPLDLRFNASGGQTAAQFLNQSSAATIEHVFRKYAEDRYAKRLAVKIVQDRRSNPVQTVQDFIAYVGTDNPKVLAPLFQALRIEVNNELQMVEAGLEVAKQALKVGGRLAVISFHSLEDRIAKEFFRSGGFEVVTKKPLIPSEEEVQRNPRSRSAKLRVGIKT